MEELNSYHGCNAISRGVLKGPVSGLAQKNYFKVKIYQVVKCKRAPLSKSAPLSQLLKKGILIKTGMPKQDLPQSERESYFISVNTIFHILGCGSFEI